MGHRSRMMAGITFLLFFVLILGCRQGPYPIPTPTPSFPKTFPVMAEEAGPSFSGNSGLSEKALAAQAVFNRECNACHPGGGSGVGPGLRNLGGKMNQEGFARAVRNGVGMMPGFKADRVSDSDLAGMWEFLTGTVTAGVQPPAAGTPEKAATTVAPKPAVTPAPKADVATGGASGQRVFEQQQCNACHPGAGQGVGPGVKDLGTKMTLEGFTRVIREGKGMMPGYKVDRLADGDLAALWNYLKDVK